ncbi:MAG: tyrosine-type recombinase/integrase [Bdellovibrionales bacterium]
MKAKITKRIVDSLTADKKTGDITVWDTEVSGFGLRCRVAGGKYYAVKVRCKGKQRWVTIGRHGSPWTPEEARQEAMRLLGDVAKDVDPSEKRDADRHALTVKELCALYLKEGCATKKASTLATDRGRITRHILPLMGRLRVKDVSRADVERFVQDVAQGKTVTDVKTVRYGRAIVSGGKGTATRTAGLLSGIFTFAVGRGLRADNPVYGVKRFKDKKCERFLSEKELGRLGKALRKAEKDGENKSTLDAIRLLMLTGCRKSEILTLRWQFVDMDRGCLRLPESKTGAKIVPIGKAAVDLLRSLPKNEGSPYVFASNKEGTHIVGIQKVWDSVRESAKLADVRLHDLRHSFASIGASNGDSLLMIGALLGHKDAKTTARYAHLSDNPIKQAADRIAGVIAAALCPRPTYTLFPTSKIPARIKATPATLKTVRGS